MAGKMCCIIHEQIMTGQGAMVLKSQRGRLDGILGRNCSL